MSENIQDNNIVTDNSTSEMTWKPWISKARSDVQLPCPAFGSGGITITTAVNGGTNAKGDFIGTVVGNDKLSISISYNHLNPEEFQKFLMIFDRTQNGAYVNTYEVFDPRKNDFVELKMYVSDRSATPYSLDKYGRPTGWVSVSATLTEV